MLFSLSSAIFITLPHYGILEIEPDERSDGRPPSTQILKGIPPWTRGQIHCLKMPY
jgi:hypothetical protein